jgi:hypothetical protein
MNKKYSLILKDNEKIIKSFCLNSKETLIKSLASLMTDMQILEYSKSKQPLIFTKSAKELVYSPKFKSTKIGKIISENYEIFFFEILDK